MLKYINYILLLCALPLAFNAQTNTRSNKPKAPVKKTAAPVSNKQITIILKNAAEKPVSVFIGSKEEIRSPKAKLKTLGGLSKNTVYVKVSDVVCLMNAQEKPTACTDIKATTTTVEISASANEISNK